MNSLRIIIGRLAVIVGGLTGALLAFWSGTGPAAMAASLGGDPRGHPGLPYGHTGLPYHHPAVTYAQPVPPPGPPGWNKHPPLPAHAHALATSGMPGWQIALIAVGAALLAAALAVAVYRIRAARRRVAVSAA
jgi:ABC-type antimicrobial peptide transport system permease subunit